MNEHTLNQIKKTAKIAMSNTLDAQHDWSHVVRVKLNALRIVEILNIKGLDLNLLEAICYLHDWAYTAHKFSLKTFFWEGAMAVNLLKKELDAFTLTVSEKKLILEAIRHHTLAVPFRRLNRKRNLYCQILQDADLLDMFNSARLKIFKTRSRSNPLFIRLVNLMSNPDKQMARVYNRLDRYLNLKDLVKFKKELIHL